jgi:hypothetical protein
VTNFKYFRGLESAKAVSTVHFRITSIDTPILIISGEVFRRHTPCYPFSSSLTMVESSIVASNVSLRQQVTEGNRSSSKYSGRYGGLILRQSAIQIPTRQR